MIPVILSGGSGSRLWPLSRKQFPKQFLALTGEHTLFQQTLERLVFEGMDTPIVVCNKEHRFIVNEQLAARNLECQRILMEPFGRNTSPAVALTAMMLVNEGRDELMLVLPADHVLEDQKALQRALALATVAAENGEMVLFGVPATKPETGYGYTNPPLIRCCPKASAASRTSSKNRTSSAPPSTSNPAVTTGTAACSCSAPAASSKN
jgi:mannose-1-phosphate guanylyltransferase / mannose-6-phosphate isomerase